MYRIKYSYQTGDSFHTEDREDFLEYEWKSLELAKEALERIEEHYAWYKSIEWPRLADPLERPKWHKISEENASYAGCHNIINLRMDDGKDIQFWCPWCGYFERLYGAEIVSSELDELKFTIQ